MTIGLRIATGFLIILGIFIAVIAYNRAEVAAVDALQDEALGRMIKDRQRNE